jgi:hypothetical protein
VQQKAFRWGIWHPSVMQFYSGPLIHFLSGVDRRLEPVASTRSSHLPDAFPSQSNSCAACSPRGWRPIARDWDQSERCFAQCLAVMPTDGPATVFHRRIKLLRGKTLPTDWDGVWQLTDK